MLCRTLRAVWVGILLILLPLTSLAYVGSTDGGSTDESAPLRLVVKMKANLDPKLVTNQRGVVQTGVDDFDQLNRAFEVRQQSELFSKSPFAHTDPRLRNVFVLTVDEGVDVLQMKDSYETLESVEYAHPDYQVELYDTPNDPLYPHQWYLNNTGQGFYHVVRIEGDYNDTLAIVHGTPDADINAEEVWQNPPDNTSTVVVAMIDSGVDLDHPDLIEHIWINPGETPANGKDDDHNGYIDDYQGWDFMGDMPFLIPDNDPTDVLGHGTHCAGIIASIANNSVGVAGVAADCRIMALALEPFITTAPAAEAMVYAADNGAHVFNMSFGTPFPVPIWEDALDYAADKGVVLITSAGNTGIEEANTPAGYDITIAVAASDCNDHITEFSTYGEHLSLCAPGQSILSLRADDTDMFATRYEPDVHIIDENYYLCSGTSMAGPVVVGVAAYLLSVSPGLDRERVKDILEQTADDFVDPYGDGSSYPGFDKYSGYGRVNLAAALAAAPQIRARISSPILNQAISGAVEIIGIADGAGFTDYVLEYGEGNFPETWAEITSSAVPVTNDILGTWYTGDLSGIYTIRLRIGEDHHTEVRVYLVNQAVAEIAIPSVGDTVKNYVSVIGTAICPEFDRATLEYGVGDSPTEWELICESSIPASNSEIGAWMVGMLSDGKHTLRLTVYDTTEAMATAAAPVYVKSLFAGENGWSYEPDTTLGSLPNYGDFDGDGTNEVIIGTAEGALFFNTDGTPKTTGVPSLPPYDFTDLIAVGDLDGDGVDDFIALCSDSALLFGFPSSDPPFEIELPVPPAVISQEQHSISIGHLAFLMDITGDDRDEIHYRGMYLWDPVNVYIYNPDGSPFALNTVLSKDTYQPADLDGDSTIEIYSCAGDTLRQFDLDGQIIHEFVLVSDTGESWFRPEGLSAVDIDNDGKHELILCGAFQFTLYDFTNTFIWAFDEDLVLVPGWPHDTGLYYGTEGIAHPIFADLDADGVLECVAFGGTFHAWRIDGTPYIGDGFFADSPNRETLNHYVAVDIDGDGYPDLASVESPGFMSSYDKQSVVAFDNSGRLLDDWPIYTGDDIQSADRKDCPIFGDLDDDGLVDMLMVTGKNRLVFTEFENYTYRPSGFYYPYTRYNRSLDNTAALRILGECGNADGYAGVDIDDVVYLIGYIFIGGPPPVSEIAGDPDCSGAPDIDDVVYLINYIFLGGPEPCADCP